MSTKLDHSQIHAALPSIPHWHLDQGELVRTFNFEGFPQAIAFVHHVADLAEKAGHHPDIDIRYNKVRLALVTHDAGGITQSDISLAQDIDKKS